MDSAAAEEDYNMKYMSNLGKVHYHLKVLFCEFAFERSSERAHPGRWAIKRRRRRRRKDGIRTRQGFGELISVSNM